jgi:hypothetical protein
MLWGFCSYETTNSKEAEEWTQGTHELYHMSRDDTPKGDTITAQYSLQKCASVIDITSVCTSAFKAIDIKEI